MNAESWITDQISHPLKKYLHGNSNGTMAIAILNVSNVLFIVT